jgi:hypothetical protein
MSRIRRVRDLFAWDGVFNGIGGVSGRGSYWGEPLLAGIGLTLIGTVAGLYRIGRRRAVPDAGTD